MAKDVGTTETKNLPAPLAQYAIMSTDGADGADVATILRENVSGNLSAFDFDRLRVPAGGGTSWEVPTLDGIKSEPFVEGVIVHFTDPRAYWAQEFEGGNVPPDCSSDDGVVGVGQPGGACAKCALAQFGSDVREKSGKTVQGRGQACKQMRQLFLLTAAARLPYVLMAPPTSLNNLRKYFLRLASAATPFYGVVTRLALASDKNADGIKYSLIEPTMTARLTPGEVEKIRAYQSAIRGAMAHATASAADLNAAR